MLYQPTGSRRYSEFVLAIRWILTNSPGIAVFKGAQSYLFNFCFKLLEILLSQESSYFSHSPYLSNAPLSLHSIRYRQLQYTKLLDCFKWNLKFTSLEWRSIKWNRKLNFEKYDREPLTSHMHRFTLSQRGNLVKIHFVVLFSQRNVVKYHWGIQYVMEVRYQHLNHLVAEQATTNVL